MVISLPEDSNLKRSHETNTSVDKTKVISTNVSRGNLHLCQDTWTDQQKKTQQMNRKTQQMNRKTEICPAVWSADTSWDVQTSPEVNETFICGFCQKQVSEMAKGSAHLQDEFWMFGWYEQNISARTQRKTNRQKLIIYHPFLFCSSSIALLLSIILSLFFFYLFFHSSLMDPITFWSPIPLFPPLYPESFYDSLFCLFPSLFVSFHLCFFFIC